jgi:hypothetical protein
VTGRDNMSIPEAGGPYSLKKAAQCDASVFLNRQREGPGHTALYGVIAKREP